MKTARSTGVLLAMVLSALVTGLSTAADSSLPAVGSVAPDVSGTDQDGHSWKLSDLKGQSAVILYFYPKDDTPGCTKEACGFRDQMDVLKSSGVEVVGVSFDTAAQHKEFTRRYDLNFILLADTAGEIADAFGVRSGDAKVARRVSFLIDKDGVIRHITDSPDPGRHLQEMKDAAKKLAN